jgi:hypothetical protein
MDAGIASIAQVRSVRMKEVFACFDVLKRRERKEVCRRYSGNFDSLKEAALYIKKKTARNFGRLRYIRILDRDKQLEISFVRKEQQNNFCSEKPAIVSLSVSGDEPNIYLRVLWFVYVKKREAVLRYFLERRFAEIGSAIEFFQTLEMKLGPAQKVMLFGFGR